MTNRKILPKIDSSKIPPDVEVSNSSTCRYCGGPTTSGFGLAGGGYGVYEFCESCQVVVSKVQVE